MGCVWHGDGAPPSVHDSRRDRCARKSLTPSFGTLCQPTARCRLWPTDEPFSHRASSWRDRAAGLLERRTELQWAALWCRRSSAAAPDWVVHSMGSWLLPQRGHGAGRAAVVQHRVALRLHRSSGTGQARVRPLPRTFPRSSSHQPKPCGGGEAMLVRRPTRVRFRTARAFGSRLSRPEARCTPGSLAGTSRASRLRRPRSRLRFRLRRTLCAAFL